jgi:hypothetical protein
MEAGQNVYKVRELRREISRENRASMPPLMELIMLTNELGEDVEGHYVQCVKKCW